MKSSYPSPSRTSSWKDEVIPGCCFLRFTKSGLAVYGEIVSHTPTPGLFQTRSFIRSLTHPYESDTHVTSMVVLLSGEQIEEARRLDWPSDEDGLNKILFLPAN